MIQTIKRGFLAGWDDGPDALPGRKLLCWCLLFTFGWGLIAHAYGFLHDSFSHDVLNALVADNVETYWKMQLGRFSAVLYRRIIRGPVTMPWLLGLLALLWTALALFLTAKLLRIRSKGLLALTAGVLVANISFIALTATYIYELDIDLLALLGAAAAAFLWARYGWLGAALGTLFIAGSLSLYQSYLCVAVVLIMLVCIQELLDGGRFGAVFGRGLRGVGMIGVGGGIYYALLRLMARLKDIPLDTGSYNSVYTALDASGKSETLLEAIGAAYSDWAASFFDPNAAFLTVGMQRLHIAMAVLLAALLVAVLLSKSIRPAEKALLTVLVLLLPLGSNATRILSGRAVHDLMKYAFWLVYLFLLLLGRWAKECLNKPGRAVNAVALLLVALLLWQNVQTANACYVKKDLEQDAALSLMTRVVDRIEQTEGYVPGETELCFVGVSDQLLPSICGFEQYRRITGLTGSSPIITADADYYYNVYGAYFKYILNNPGRMVGHKTWSALQLDERALAMPAFPAAGCIREIDGVLVVKMGEQFEWES